MPAKTTKYPGCRLEKPEESRTPTSFIPSRAACFASATAPVRPFAAGTESSTIVQPLFPAGQKTSAAFREGGGGFRGVVPVIAVVVVGAVIVGSRGACRCGSVEGRSRVRTRVPPAELDSSARKIAESNPATTATTSVSSAGQIQSPGYQPRRRRQRLPSRVVSPGAAGIRSPHSRQYSWSSAYGAAVSYTHLTLPTSDLV